MFQIIVPFCGGRWIVRSKDTQYRTPWLSSCSFSTWWSPVLDYQAFASRPCTRAWSPSWAPQTTGSQPCPSFLWREWYLGLPHSIYRAGSPSTSGRRQILQPVAAESSHSHHLLPLRLYYWAFYHDSLFGTLHLTGLFPLEFSVASREVFSAENLQCLYFSPR